MQAYLARSQQLPLSIKFSCQLRTSKDWDAESDSSEAHSDSGEPGSCPCEPIWDALFSEKTRWKHFILDARTGAHLPSFLERIRGETFPALESFQMATWPLSLNEQGLELVAPNLTQLRIRSHDNSPIPHSTLPRFFANLTMLELANFFFAFGNTERFLKVLQVASATLQVLVLRHGCFMLEPSSTVLEALLNVDLPRLSFLVLESVTDFQDDSMHCVIPALCRAARALDRLHILGSVLVPVSPLIYSGALQLPTIRFLRYCISDDTDWHNFILTFPHLEELQISEGDPTMLLKTAMSMDETAVKSGGSMSWLHLRSLVLLGPNEYIALRFVQHRSRVGRPLHDLTYKGWFTPQAQSILKNLNVAFTPVRDSLAHGEDWTKDWIEYWRAVMGEL